MESLSQAISDKEDLLGYFTTHLHPISGETLFTTLFNDITTASHSDKLLLDNIVSEVSQAVS